MKKSDTIYDDRRDNIPKQLTFNDRNFGTLKSNIDQIDMACLTY